MSKAQATPEKWEVVRTGGCPIGVGRRTSSGIYEMLCNPILTGKGPRELPEIKRVMALMAAAPDLLAALRMLTDATIKLAPYDPDVFVAVVAIVDIARAAISKAESP